MSVYTCIYWMIRFFHQWIFCFPAGNGHSLGEEWTKGWMEKLLVTLEKLTETTPRRIHAVIRGKNGLTHFLGPSSMYEKGLIISSAVNKISCYMKSHKHIFYCETVTVGRVKQSPTSGCPAVPTYSWCPAPRKFTSFYSLFQKFITGRQ